MRSPSPSPGLQPSSRRPRSRGGAGMATDGAWRHPKQMAGISVFIVICALASSGTALRAAGVLRPGATPACTYRDPIMDPTYEVLGGQDCVWQVPTDPKAVLVFLHGESQDPFLFFDPSPNCVDCYGLPETRRVVVDALQRGYAVIAIHSISYTWDNWPLDKSADVAMIETILPAWRREHSLEHLPLVVWGHSSGGYFATGLALKMPLQGMVLSVCEGVAELIDHASPDWFPPTFFSYMFYDGNTTLTRSEDVERSMKALGKAGVPVAGKAVDGKPLSPFFFSYRIRCMTDEMSQRVYEAFLDQGWLDDDGYLVKDPEFVDWMAVLTSSGALPPCAQLDGDPCLSRDICQELKVAHGTHTFSSETKDDVFSFLEKYVLTSSEQAENPLSAVY